MSVQCRVMYLGYPIHFVIPALRSLCFSCIPFTRNIRDIIDNYICKIKIHDLCLEIYIEDERYRKGWTAEALKDGRKQDKYMHPEQQLRPPNDRKRQFEEQKRRPG